MKSRIQEGKAVIDVYSGKVSKELPVFYNPLMKLNRDISVLLIKSLERKLQIADPLAGSGVRGIRFMLEAKIKDVVFNDASKEAVKLIKKNLKLNKLKAEVHNKDANLFLLESKGFDYIDIDPFGSPVNFLDCAVKRIARKGILAVTATDTAALSGTCPKACIRKYWAVPKRDEAMHERGLRILIRRVQLSGASHSKALTPILSYSKDHYMRAFFMCEKSKEKCDIIMKNAFDIWNGQLWDEKIVKKMIEICDDEQVKKFLTIIYEESKINSLFFYNIHKICKKEKVEVPSFSELFEKIRKKGFKCSRTHFDSAGIRSDINYDELVRLIKSG